MAPPKLGPFICEAASRGQKCTHLLALPPNCSGDGDLVPRRALEAIDRRIRARKHRLVALGHTASDGRRRFEWVRDGALAASLPAYVFNPSILDEDNLLLRVSSFSMCSMNASATPADIKQNFRAAGAVPFSLTVWLHRRESVRGLIPNSEDARPFRLQGHVHAVFKRVYSPRLKRMWLAQLEPTYREVMLNFSEQRRIEMNWSPFVVNDTLYFSYTLCPHTVLRCDPHSGACTRAYESAPDGGCPGYQGADGKSRTPSAMHGGSQLVHARGIDGSDKLLGAAHFKLYKPVRGLGMPWWYLTVFYTYDGSPPFGLRGVSRPFLLPTPFGNAYQDRVQFAAGLALVDGSRYVLTYGAGDCAAMAVSLPQRFVLEEAQWEGWVRFAPNKTHLGTW